MPQAGVSTHSGDGETSCCLSPMIDFARKVCPQPFVERRESWMHARMDRIAWPRNRDRVLLGNVRARPLRQQVDFVGKAERLVHQDKPRLHGQRLCERNALALPAAEVTGKAIAEAHKIQALKPGLRLGERLLALHSVECEAERDV